LAEFSPEATMVSKAVLRPPLTHGVVQSGGEAGLGQRSARPAAGGGQQGKHVGEGFVGNGGGTLHPGHLTGVLGHAQALDQPSRRQELDPHEEVVPRPLRRPGDVVGLQAERPDSARFDHQRLPLGVHATDTDLDVRVYADSGQLLECLGAVPPVRGQQCMVTGHQQEACRTGEAAQPPDACGVGDQQSVHRSPVGSRPVEERPQTIEPARHLEWRQGRRPVHCARVALSILTTASTAKG
jgi:hypothetical protein